MGALSLLIHERWQETVDEREVAQRWWRLPLPSLLPLTDGGSYQLLYAGRPGGSVGPDVHDAVLVVPATETRLMGDIEFHTASSEWRQHGHQYDARYNQVILHIVLVCDDTQPTLRQDGIAVPVCSLLDLPTHHSLVSSTPPWPCQHIVPLMSAEARDKLLTRAGLLRFEQKTIAFVEQLHRDLNDVEADYNRCLFLALAEALAYGRDRAIFRALGYKLLGLPVTLPEPQGYTSEPPPLDTQRLHVLRSLVTQLPNLWSTLRSCMFADTTHESLLFLRVFFHTLGLSLARTDILLCNVVLPFAAAVALLEDDLLLIEQAERLYSEHPGLPSNAVTRIMTTQLCLQHEPRSSCQQQGLHYIYQQTCREKRCEVCIAGRERL